MPKTTPEEQAAIDFEEALYAQRATPLFIACRRFVTWVEEEYSDPTEMPEWLLAKGLMLDLKDHIDSVTVKATEEKFEDAAEKAHEDYLEITEEFLPPALPDHVARAAENAEEIMRIANDPAA